MMAVHNLPSSACDACAGRQQGFCMSRTSLRQPGVFCPVQHAAQAGTAWQTVICVAGTDIQIWHIVKKDGRFVHSK